MRLFGTTNLVISNDKNLGVFMFDFDNIDYFSVKEETKFLSECFDIDIFILQSSKNSYHIIIDFSTIFQNFKQKY
ncbi:MAG TPA: hypothetical protein PK683_19475 [Leptospiraceae bacterium]|nr:hypothetical protein [Leptospiraceae bacterium]